MHAIGRPELRAAAALGAATLLACGQAAMDSGFATQIETETAIGTATEITSATSDASAGWTSEDSATTGEPAPSLDEQLAAVLADQAVPVEPLEPLPGEDPALVELGEALFFDPILSGPKDTACASCHHPSHGSGDGLSLALGTGAVGIGPARAQGPHPAFVPRHAMALFNLGHEDATRMFWDARVELDEAGELRTPLGDALLPGLDDALAAQAMFPVLDRQEMRGAPGSMTVLSEINELGELPDDDPQAIWSAIMARLGAIPGYVELFAAAYPERSFAELSFADAANALAAYEREAFAMGDAAWDAYLRGDPTALSDAAKLGAILFYDRAGCGACHSGPLLSDQQIHSTGVPQLGPGAPGSAPFDHGRELVTGEAADRFGFRTPSLRNVEVSAPYMHDGALVSFEKVLFHYGSPTTSIPDFDASVLLPELVDTVQRDPEHVAEIVASLSPDLVLEPNFVGLSNLREFLESLTDPAVFDLAELRPSTVPSGLPPA